jgi:NAD-dependent DNA ligase
MATQKVIAILHSRGAPFTLEEMSTMNEKDAWDWIYANPAPKKIKPKLIEICFTGFTPEEKATFTELAVQKGILVRTSVTKNLSFLVASETPGSTKMEKAIHQGVEILNVESFYKMINTGEIK